MEVIGNRPYFFFENGAILKQNEEKIQVCREIEKSGFGGKRQ